MNYNCLFWYIDTFMIDSGIPKYAFCKALEIPSSTYYAWRAGRIKLSHVRARKINKYLEQFGYAAPELKA